LSVYTNGEKTINCVIKLLPIPKPANITLTRHTLRGRGGLLLWERSESEVWLDDAELWEENLGLLVGNWRGDDDVVSWDPVDWGGDTVLIGGLERVDDTEDLGGVAASGGWVGEDETDSLLWVNDEDGTDGESDALLIDVGGILVINHVVGKSDLTLLVTNDWELEISSGDLIDVLDPSSVRVNGVGGKTNQLDATLGELWLELGESSELGGADWSVILWVGEEDYPLVADELVEVDWAIGGLSLEVWGGRAETKWGSSLRHDEYVIERLVVGMK